MFEPDRERLDHRAVIVGHAFGNFVHHVFVEQHQLAETAGAFVAVADHLVRAFGQHHRHRSHPPPGLDLARAAGPIVEHLADVFVAGYERLLIVERRVRPAELLRQFDDVAPALEEMLVRCAQPAGMGAHQRLALARHRIGHLADLDHAVFDIGCFHQSISAIAASIRGKVCSTSFRLFQPSSGESPPSSGWKLMVPWLGRLGSFSISMSGVQAA